MGPLGRTTPLIGPYRTSVGFPFFSNSVQKIGENPFDSCTQVRRHLLSRTFISLRSISVLSAGIEPASPPSEGGILSIERREGLNTDILPKLYLLTRRSEVLVCLWTTRTTREYVRDEKSLRQTHTAPCIEQQSVHAGDARPSLRRRHNLREAISRGPQRTWPYSRRYAPRQSLLREVDADHRLVCVGGGPSRHARSFHRRCGTDLIGRKGRISP